MSSKRKINRQFLRRSLIEQLEKRELLAADGPRILQAGISSSSWTAGYEAELHRQGLSDSDGFLHIDLSSGEKQALPWESVDQIKLDFDQAVASVIVDRLKLTDENGVIVAASDVAPSADGRSLVFSFPSQRESQRWMANIDDAIASVAGVFLDGENPADATQPSGDGRPGGALRLLFSSLPGDANGDESVGFSDYFSLRDAYDSSIGDSRYDMMADFNGDGRVNFRDYFVMRDSYGTSVPHSNPQLHVFNNLPEAQAQSVDLSEDETKSFDLQVSDQDGDQLTVVIEQPPANGEVSFDGTAVQYVPNQDFFGADQFIYHVTDGRAYSESTTVDLDVSAVNDPPFVISEPQTIILSDFSPRASIDLNTVFADIDSNRLTFEILDSDDNLIDATLNGAVVEFAGLARTNGNTNVVVQAKDEFGSQVSSKINVVVQRRFLQPSAQIVPSSETVSVNLEILAIPVDQLTLRSSNSQLLPVAALQMVDVADGAELTISHSGSEFGATFISVEHNGVPIAGFVALIMPPEVLNEGPTNPRLEVSLTPAQERGGTTFQTFRKVVDDQAVAWLYHSGAIDSSTAIGMLEPDYRSFYRGQVRMLPTIVQSSAGYSVSQDYWNETTEHSLNWLDEIDAIWSNYEDLTAVEEAVQSRNPRSDVTNFLKSVSSTSYLSSLSAAMSEVDPTREPELYTELITAMNAQIASFSRTQHGVYNADDTQSAVLATEFVANSGIGLASAWGALGSAVEDGSSNRSRNHNAQQARYRVSNQPAGYVFP